MMESTIHDFIAKLGTSGFTVTVADGRIQVSHPTDRLDDAARQFFRENKESIIALLTARRPSLAGPIPPEVTRRIIEAEMAKWTDEHRQEFEREIQAILEYRRRRGLPLSMHHSHSTDGISPDIIRE